MFETVQPEQNSGSSKVVGVVIVAVVVVMVGFYFLFLRGEPGETPRGDATAAASGGAAMGDEEPNAQRDLSILKSNMGRDQTGTMALWDIQLSNRSRTLTYRNIRYATNYYSGDGALLYQNENTLSDELTPGDQKTISGLNDGLFPVGTVNYTIEIKSAEGVRQ